MPNSTVTVSCAIFRLRSSFSIPFFPGFILYRLSCGMTLYILLYKIMLNVV
jgi:hypothetical protein